MEGRGKVGRGREVWQQHQQQLLLWVHLLLRQVWQQQLQQHLVAAVLEQLLLLQAEEQQPVGQLAVQLASSAADSAEQQVDHLLEQGELLDQAEQVELAGLPVVAVLALLQVELARLPSADGRLPEGGKAKGIVSCIGCSFSLRSLSRETSPPD